MSTRGRLVDYAEALSAALDLPVYAEPGSPGRGNLYAYVEAPTLLYESTSSTFCPAGREPRLDTSIVLVGTGVAPGQLLALYDALDRLVDVVDTLPGFMASADATPGDYQGTPAYVVPVRSL